TNDFSFTFKYYFSRHSNFISKHTNLRFMWLYVEEKGIISNHKLRGQSAQDIVNEYFSIATNITSSKFLGM
ncbi:MAG TPA: hypothetical protein VD694_03870, partial [Nitrososphaeraceae archaeon]|nr:hypothetical protein [Nitrososphaeraceae archaeon]